MGRFDRKALPTKAKDGAYATSRGLDVSRLDLDMVKCAALSFEALR
jgi:hypothetical protein